MKRVWSVPNFVGGATTPNLNENNQGEKELKGATVESPAKAEAEWNAGDANVFDFDHDIEYFDGAFESPTPVEGMNGNVVYGNVPLEKPMATRVHSISGKLREYEEPKLTEVYGFVGWLMSGLALIIFLLWAIMPEHVWDDFGVTYYPSRYWALAIPAYVVMSYFFMCAVHVGIGLMRTPPLGSAKLISDQYTREARDFSRLARSVEANVGTPEIYDIPITVTNRLLYSNRTQRRNLVTNESRRRRYRFGQSNPRSRSNLISPPTSGIMRARSMPMAKGPSSASSFFNFEQ